VLNLFVWKPDNKLRGFARRAKRLLDHNHPDRFLRRTSGIIHIGANAGPERYVYNDYRLPVIWVEPIPDVFEKLKMNIRDLPKQRAFRNLITDRDEVEYEFHISNNDGASSSILDFKDHADIWPEVKYSQTIKLTSTTLATLVAREGIDIKPYDALVMDTQGSELLVLQGAAPLLPNFRFVKVEAPNFEAYVNCCQLSDIESFMSAHGFREISRYHFASHPSGGAYFDVVYENIALT
jgi:FkbM family methyltransferase